MQSKQYYEDVSKSLNYAKKAFIDGKYVDALSRKTFFTKNPATGQTIAEIADCGADDVDRAVAAAKKAYEDRRWAGMGAAERRSILQIFADIIESNLEELAVMESMDSGKPIFDTINGDIPEACGTIRWHAEAADKIEDVLTITKPDNIAMVVKEPIGVVGAILPWNFPILMASWKLAPILASGNSLVMKPAKLTPLTALKLGEYANEAGIPAGVLNILPGSGVVVGEAMATHMDINLITFTGSTEVGRNLLVKASQSNLKRVLLELGGKNPCIIMPDLQDIDVAAGQAIFACFWNMGENCTSNSRLIIHKDVKDALIPKLLEKVSEWKTGAPLDPQSRSGALIEEKHMLKVLAYIERAKEEGAKLIYGGNQMLKESGGYYIEPTIFDNVTSGMTIAREEVFGPILSIMNCESEEEAIAIANDTPYGLQASLFSGDISRAHRMARAIQAGTVSVNCYSEGDISTPFGGFKQSGFFGRDKSLWANRQYSELKTIWIQL